MTKKEKEKRKVFNEQQQSIFVRVGTLQCQGKPPFRMDKKDGCV